MNQTENKTIITASINKYSAVKYLLAPLVFVVLVLISQFIFKGARLDLTEQNIYSLSEGTENILSDLEQDISITFFFSDKVSKDLTSVRSYAKRVEELLEEYALLSGGKLTLKTVDPEPFSAAEDRAAEAGLQAVPIATGDNLYLGIQATNSLGKESVIAFLQPDKESFLEYEITEMIYRLGQKTVPVIGLMSELDIRGGFDMQQGGALPPWTIFEQLDQLYDVRWVDEKLDELDELDEDLELLILVQPTAVSESSLYLLDQYVMNGGKLLIFVDPKAETKQQPHTDMAEEAAADLNPLSLLFEKWEVEYDPTNVLIDAAYGLTISVGEGRAPVRHLGLLGIQVDGLNPNEVATAELESINFASTGSLVQKQKIDKQASAVLFDPLVWSSGQSQQIGIDQYNAISDPTELLLDFNPDGESKVLAVRLSGRAESAFSQKPESSDYAKEHKTNTENLNVIVVADTDVLSDRLWVQVQNFFGQRIAQPWADNGAFVHNLTEQYLGSSDLINIRSRGRFVRPFEVVQDIQQTAERAYLDNERMLQQQLEITEQKLAELESQRSKESMTLSPEQEAALTNFQMEKLNIRKDLRDVQHALNKDIENLGSWLKALNIALMPILLTLLVWLIARRRLKKS
jgi:ABC-type uncharacterized transport system involved in gliding motility auxiliary subunit